MNCSVTSKELFLILIKHNFWGGIISLNFKVNKPVADFVCFIMSFICIILIIYQEPKILFFL